MKTTSVFTLAIGLTLLAAEGLSAQRRGTSGGGSGDRSQPSSGGSRGGSSSGGSRGSDGGRGGSTSSPSRGGSGERPSGSDRSGNTGSVRASGRDGSSTASSSANRGSKIAGVRAESDRAARRVSHGGVYISRGFYVGCYYNYCDPYWGWYGDRWGWYHGGYWYPARRRYYHDHDYEDRDDRDDRDDANEYESEARAVYGYDEYPYASGDGFAQRRPGMRRGFGAISGGYFRDNAGTGLEAGRFALEGARGLLRGELEYAGYVEPNGATPERMHSFRLGVGVQPRLGDAGYITATVGFRAISMNNGGQNSGGPELALGVQLMPVKPLGINVTGRAAALTWDGNGYSGLRELNTTGSIFINRLEIQGGWHWMKIGAAPAFTGPVAGLRVWF